MSPKDTTEQHNLIDAIKTPLGFFSLIVVVIESSLVGLALASSGADRSFLVRAIPAILVLLTLLVAVIGALKPEALWGKRYSALEESFAAGLGEEIYVALDGALGNLEETAREEAYGLLREIITSSTHARSRTTKKFCQILTETIIRRARIMKKFQEALGVVRSSTEEPAA
jgi:hypothetical protein